MGKKTNSILTFATSCHGIDVTVSDEEFHKITRELIVCGSESIAFALKHARDIWQKESK